MADNVEMLVGGATKKNKIPVQKVRKVCPTRAIRTNMVRPYRRMSTSCKMDKFFFSFPGTESSSVPDFLLLLLTPLDAEILVQMKIVTEAGSKQKKRGKSTCCYRISPCQFSPENEDIVMTHAHPRWMPAAKAISAIFMIFMKIEYFIFMHVLQRGWKVLCGVGKRTEKCWQHWLDWRVTTCWK